MYIIMYVHRHRLSIDMIVNMKQYVDTTTTCRFSGAHAHYFINDFLQSVAGMYQESGRARDFVLDLLWLNASGLLAIDPGTGERETSKEEGEKVQKDFKQFLHNFIRRNALKHSLLGEMSVIMVWIMLLCACV